MVRVGILGICVTSSVLRVLSSGFLVSGSQVFSPRHPVPVSFVSGSHVLGSLVSGSQNPMSWVLGLRVSGSLVWESQSPRFRVSGPDFRLCQKISYERGIKTISPRQASPRNRASSPLYEQPHNIYFDDVQRNRWLDLSSSLRRISHRWDLFRKRIHQKNL